MQNLFTAKSRMIVNMKKYAGVTLIEVMISIVMVAILAALAAPSFMEFIENLHPLSDVILEAWLKYVGWEVGKGSGIEPDSQIVDFLEYRNKKD